MYKKEISEQPRKNGKFIKVNEEKADLFSVFQPYENEQRQQQSETVNKEQPTLTHKLQRVEPVLRHNTGVLETGSPFEDNKQVLREPIQPVNIPVYLTGGLLRNGKYAGWAALFLSGIYWSNKIEMTLSSGSSKNSALQAFQSVIGRKIYKDFSLWNGILSCFLVLEGVIFFARQIVKIPYRIKEEKERNKLEARLNLLKREEEFQTELTAVMNRQLVRFEAQQLVIRRARKIFINQVHEEQENRAVLEAKYGVQRLPIADEDLGKLLLGYLGKSYGQERRALTKDET